MKHVNTGSFTGLPTACLGNAAILKTKRAHQSHGMLAKTRVLLSFALLLSLQLITGRANAQILAQHTGTGCGGTCTTLSNAPGTTNTGLLRTGLGINSPCGSGGISGITNNGVTTFSTSNGRVYFTITANPGQVLNVTNITAKMRRSGSGIQNVRFAYQVGSGPIVVDPFDKAPQNTSCGSGTTVGSWAGTALPTGASSVTVYLYPYNPISTGGVVQFNDITVSGTVTTVTPTCPGTIASGTVTPSSSTVCGGTTTALTLSGATTGGTIAYQWAEGTAGSGTFNPIPGATTTVYNATPSVSTDYRVITSCTVGTITATSSVANITVTPPPSAGTINVVPAAIVGTTYTLTATGATTTGVLTGWSSLNMSVGTIDAASGAFTGSFGGSTQISYTVYDISTGCQSTATATQNVLWPNTLGLETGSNGAATPVIVLPNETSSAFAATGFGSATGCTTGGLSGLTVNTTVATYSPAGPHASFVLTPDATYALNLNEIHAKVRVSGTGPTMARLAYNIAGTWYAEATDHVLSTTSSCGSTSATNDWYFTLPASVTGITTPLEIAVFAYAPGASTGTFQVNQLEAIGTVSSATPCSGVPMAGVITPSVTTVCNSGYAAMSFTGDAGPGISYSWEQSTDGGVTYSPISGASSTYYTSPVYSTVPTTILYQVVTTCSNSGSVNASPASTFQVVGVPTITATAPNPFISGGTATLTATPAGGVWSSDNSAVALIGSTSGIATAGITGTTDITYNLGGFGCTAATTVNVIHSNYVSIYSGTGGTSTTVNYLDPNVTASALGTSGTFGSNTPCSNGGFSGLTVNTVIATYNPANPHVVYTLTATPGYQINVTSILATTRSSGTGPQNYQIAYSLDGGTTWTANGTDIPTSLLSCGTSNAEGTFTTSISGTSILVAVFPYGATSNTGTFQVNSLSVLGSVCAIPTAIIDGNSGMPLNGEGYDYTCADGFNPIALSSTPSGGTWSSLNPGVAAVDASTGDLSFSDPGATDVNVVIVYTSPCGATTTATVTVSETNFPGCTGSSRPANTSVNNVTVNDITIYPNPATSTINIAAAEAVNVSVLSMDGRTLIKKDATSSINVSSLPNGVYMIQVYNGKNALIKTAKFTKE